MKNSITKKDLRIDMSNLLHSTVTNDKNVNFEKKTKNYIRAFLPFSKADLVLAYYPMQYEASCYGILNVAYEQNKKVAFPKINNNSMTFHLCNSFQSLSSFTKNSYGVYEPNNEPINFEKTIKTYDSIIIFVPGLAFASNGSRLGRGKGYYDKFLSYIINNKLSTTVLTLVGLCFSFQIYEHFCTEAHDIEMDYVLSESGLTNCNEMKSITT